MTLTDGRAARPPRRSCSSSPRPATPRGASGCCTEYRAGLELIRLALEERRSPYAAVAAGGVGHAAAGGRRRPRGGAAAGRSRGRPPRRSASTRTAHAVRAARVHPAAASGRPQERPMSAPRSCSGSSCPTSAWRSSSSATTGGTATTSSAGRRARPSSTSARLLRWGSPLFHFGILFVLLGHIGGPGHPEVVDRGGRHVRDRVPRRGRRHRRHRRLLHPGRAGDPDLPAAHRRAGVLRDHQNDKFMYVVLAATILLRPGHHGSRQLLGPRRHDYRETVSPWFRSASSTSSPEPELMAERRARVPAARPVGAAAVRHLAVHPARARVQRAGRLPHPALHRLPQPRRAAGQPAAPRGWERVGGGRR